MSFSVGQKIELNDGRIAIVRFVGETSFQTGEWVGIELEERTGKNDGAVQGTRYFDCEQGYGMFCRPAGVKQVLVEARPKATGNGAATKPRPTSTQSTANGVKRQSGVPDGAAKRTSVAPSPTPGARAVTGIRSPTKQVPANGVSSTSTSRTSTPPVGKKPAASATARTRTSMAPPATPASATRRTSTLTGAPATRTSRPSIAASPATTKSRPSTTGRAPPARVGTTARSSASNAGRNTDEASSQRSGILSPRTDPSSSQASQNEHDGDDEQPEDEPKPNFAPPPVPPIPEEPPQTRSRRPSSPTAASIHSQRTIRSTTAANKQIEELEAKIRLLERKRQEDRDIRKNLEQAERDRDQYKSIIERLQNKYKPQQQEIAQLKKALQEAETKGQDVSGLQAEHESAMELLTLDREMAEEKAQNLEEQYEALKVKAEEMELELEILREENEEFSKEMSPEERSSAGWLQLEKSNERLREALLRLRDISQDKEEELKEQISELEEQLKDSESAKKLFDETKEKLDRSEADVNDLRQQLEVAEESEEMIEQLSEQKSNLEERIHQLRVTIEELEELKELNDELVINHQEDEKQLQEELDFKDNVLLDRERTAKQQQEALDEADYTINKYRVLVRELQGSLQEMQASKQLSETEASELNTRSRAMLELNMKLQSSAAKTQVKTIDLELRRLEAQEASEHLAIVQLFLPDAYRTERDSVLALLRFRRIAFKANLLGGFVKERLSSFGTRGHDEDAFAACHVLDELTWIASNAERFVNSIRGCDAHEFAKFESALYELEPVEKALNTYIDALRRDEFQEKDIAESLERSMAVMAHLATIHIKDDMVSHADHLLSRSLCLQGQLESTASAIVIMRTLIEQHTKRTRQTRDEEDSEQEQQTGETDDDDSASSDFALLLSRADSLNTQTLNAKVVASKIYRALNDLSDRSLTLDVTCNEDFERVENTSREIASYTREAGTALQDLFGEEGRTTPYTPSEVASALARAAATAFSLPAPEAGPFAALNGRSKELAEMLTNLANLTTDLDNTVEFERGAEPWVARANELQQIKTASVDTEAQLHHALETVKDREMTVKEKEKELEEQSVKIEMLEARMKDASKRSARIAELEKVVHETKDAEKKARSELVRAKQDAQRDMERVRDEMSRLAEEKRKGAGSGDIDSDAMGAGARAASKRQMHKITSLEGAVRYLKEENHRLRLPTETAPLGVRSNTDWLKDPLVPPKSRRQQRREAAANEGKDMLQQMLQLATGPRAQTIDLTKLPENKLAWRPAKQTPRWNIERRKEEWEGLRDWRLDIIRGGRRGVNSVYKISDAATRETEATGDADVHVLAEY